MADLFDFKSGEILEAGSGHPSNKDDNQESEQDTPAEKTDPKAFTRYNEIILARKEILCESSLGRLQACMIKVVVTGKTGVLPKQKLPRDVLAHELEKFLNAKTNSKRCGHLLNILNNIVEDLAEKDWPSLPHI